MLYCKLNFFLNTLFGYSFFLTCCSVRPYFLHKFLTILRSKWTYLLAVCDNIQKGHYISQKQLTNGLVTLFIMSHTCDKLSNSVTPNKSKSKQLANSVWGLFVAIYRCSQAVTALQSTIRGNLLMTHLRWQVLHSTHGSDEFGSLFCYTTPPQQLFTCLQFVFLPYKLQAAVNDETYVVHYLETGQVEFKSVSWMSFYEHLKLLEFCKFTWIVK